MSSHFRIRASFLLAESWLGWLKQPGKSNGDGQISRHTEGKANVQEFLIPVRGKFNGQMIRLVTDIFCIAVGVIPWNLEKLLKLDRVTEAGEETYAWADIRIARTAKMISQNNHGTRKGGKRTKIAKRYAYLREIHQVDIQDQSDCLTIHIGTMLFLLPTGGQSGMMSHTNGRTDSHR